VTLRTPEDFARAGLVPHDAGDELAQVTARYAAAMSDEMAALADPRDAADPIARQFVPSPSELVSHTAELDDPIGDNLKSPVKGVVHRYPDRVLLKLAGVCPVYCRFCFRREMVGPDFGHNLTSPEIDDAIAYIASDPKIWEVIFTGGDPFVLSPRRIADVTQRIPDIPHVKILRWHTRVPCVAPDLVTPALVKGLRTREAAVFVGLHTNHARELTPSARAAVARLVDAGIPVVSQTVLLRGVNDDADTLEGLMRALVETRITPYYLHHPDLTPGTSHFRVPIARGLELMAELRRRLSGLAMPDYVLDIPGAHGKVSLLSSAVRAVEDHYEITGRDGHVHRYTDAL
jgi:lysine 2,3-aminomutase